MSWRGFKTKTAFGSEGEGREPIWAGSNFSGREADPDVRLVIWWVCDMVTWLERVQKFDFGFFFSMNTPIMELHWHCSKANINTTHCISNTTTTWLMFRFLYIGFERWGMQQGQDVSNVQAVVYSAIQRINQKILFTRDSSHLWDAVMLLNLMESLPETGNPAEATLYPGYLLRSSISRLADDDFFPSSVICRNAVVSSQKIMSR